MVKKEKTVVKPRGKQPYQKKAKSDDKTVKPRGKQPYQKKAKTEDKTAKPRGKQPYQRKDKEEEASEVEEVSQDDDSDYEAPNIANALVPSGGGLLEDDGFEDLDEEESFIAKQNQAGNKKRKKSGGFQSMGLSYPIYKAILHKGFKVPTPIQRKTVPIIMEGQDVVGMARTGSGKTAAFLIPLLEKLKSHSAKVGARAVVLSPSRELAMQTQKVVKDLGKYTDLRSCIIVGGDNMEDQFQMLAANPDIIIATPGRLLHLIVEMDYDLKSVEYIVFDEADRLFEMGFSIQLHEILSRLPSSRQTLLFSATLPKLLVDFAKAGLQSPTLVRLDADTKISKDLEMAFFSIKHEEKESSLLLLLRDVIKTQKVIPGTKHPEDKKRKIEDLHQTIIFVSTKHHVEYIYSLLTKAGYAVSYIYGSLDQTARKIEINDFRIGRTSVLVVTDVAARGIDIPVLENVINYDFVDSSKVFIHRVGRVARAGRRGWAYSLITNEELPYLVDLQLFLGRQLTIGQKANANIDYTKEMVLGSLPRNLLELNLEWMQNVLHDDVNMAALLQVSKNGYKLYCKSRPSAAPESYKRSKEIVNSPGFTDIHPLLAEAAGNDEQERLTMINRISGFRPHETIFEIGNRGTKKATEAAIIMKKRRSIVGNVIEAKKAEVAKSRMNETVPAPKKKADDVNEAELLQIFGYPKSTKKSYRDEEYYMSYTQADANTEKGYSMTQSGSFAEQAQSAVLDLQGDERDTMQAKKNLLRWDSKKKNFVRGSGIGADNKKLITTENGTKLPASYKSGTYEDWQKKNRVHMPRTGELEVSGKNMVNKRYKHNKLTAPKKLDPLSINYEKKIQKKRKGTEDVSQQGNKRRVGDNAKGELKSVDQIRKQRELKEKRREKTGRHNKGGSKPKRGKGRK